MCSPIVYLYYCYCTFINLYVGFPFFYVSSFICASSGSFVPHMDRQKLFFEIVKSLYWFEILFNQTLIKSLGGTKILSFNEVFNSLSLCFVYLVLFYKPFQTFIYMRLPKNKDRAMLNIAPHRRLNIVQHKSHLAMGLNSGAPQGQAVAAPLVAPVVLLLIQIQ